MSKHTLNSAAFCAIACGTLMMPAFHAAADDGQPPGRGMYAGNEHTGSTPNGFSRRPILVFETAGFALSGFVHRRLTVYTDGLVSISIATGIPGDNASSKAAFTTVSRTDVEALRQTLAFVGVGSLTDGRDYAADVPLTTVTFFPQSGARAISNSYSYYLAEGPYRYQHQLIHEFMTRTFPDF